MPVLLALIILTFTQGMTEYLPVSSSAHIGIVTSFLPLGSKELSWMMLTLITASYVSLGTFFAGAWCLRQEISQIIRDFWQWLRNPKSTQLSGKMTNLFWVVFVATVPLVIVGLLLHIDNLYQSLLVTALTLIGFGWLLYYVDKRIQESSFSAMTLRHGFLIGLSQILALLSSGVSRAGIAITVGRYFGYDRIKALRFALLLGLPTILGTSLLGFVGLNKSSAVANTSPIWHWSYLGMVIGGFVLSVIVIKWMLWYFKNHDFKIIAWYRTVVGAIILLLFFLL